MDRNYQLPLGSVTIVRNENARQPPKRRFLCLLTIFGSTCAGFGDKLLTTHGSLKTTNGVNAPRDRNYPFLTAATLTKYHHLPGRRRRVRDNHMLIGLRAARVEKVQLRRTLQRYLLPTKLPRCENGSPASGPAAIALAVRHCLARTTQRGALYGALVCLSECASDDTARAGELGGLDQTGGRPFSSQHRNLFQRDRIAADGDGWPLSELGTDGCNASHSHKLCNFMPRIASGLVVSSNSFITALQRRRPGLSFP